MEKTKTSDIRAVQCLHLKSVSYIIFTQFLSESFSARNKVVIPMAQKKKKRRRKNEIVIFEFFPQPPENTKTHKLLDAIKAQIKHNAKERFIRAVKEAIKSPIKCKNNSFAF